MVKNEQEVAAFSFVAVPVEGAGGREQPFVNQFTAVACLFRQSKSLECGGEGIAADCTDFNHLPCSDVSL